MVWFSNGWDYSHSWNWTVLKSDLQKVRISNVSQFQVAGFQIPTVNLYKLSSVDCSYPTSLGLWRHLNVPLFFTDSRGAWAKGRGCPQTGPTRSWSGWGAPLTWDEITAKIISCTTMLTTKIIITTLSTRNRTTSLTRNRHSRRRKKFKDSIFERYSASQPVFRDYKYSIHQ